MSQNKRGRVAVVAAAALVGGLVPVLSATAASAVAPTVLAVSPAAANANSAADTTKFVVKLNNAPVAGVRVIADIFSGPDNAIAQDDCVVDAASTATFNCSVKTTGLAGVASIRFFYDAANTGTFQASDPNAEASITIGGVVNSVALTPSTSHAAIKGYAAYTVSALDAQARPVSGATVKVAATQKNADGTAVAGTAIDVTATKPLTGAIKGATGAVSADIVTSDGEAVDSKAGSGLVYVASDVAGTVGLTVTGPNAGITALGSLTVNSATANDVARVVVSPATQKSFTGNRTVTETITLMNAQGDLVSGVTPLVSLTGINAGVTLTAPAATDGTGSTTVSYLTGTKAGTDTIQAYVAQTDNAVNTGGLDAEEPRGTATVVLAEDVINDGGLTATNSGTEVPSDVATTPITFKLVTNATPAAPAVGYSVDFTVADAKFTLSQKSGITDAKGLVTVNLTKTDLATLGAATVTAVVVGDTTVKATSSATWIDRASQTNIAISPALATAGAAGTVTHTVAATDYFGAAVPGLTYSWTVSGTRNNSTTNTAVTGTGSSFTYKDALLATTSGSDTLTVIAQKSNADGSLSTVGTAEATQYWVPGTAKAAQVNIDLQGADGSYEAAKPFKAIGFENVLTGSVEVAATTSTPVLVKLADALGDNLIGKSVSFTSTGSGGFVVDSKIVTTTNSSVVVGGFATVQAKSTQTGTQTITATVDGISATATIDYTGQYVANTPKRVLDSRIGLGSFVSNNGNAVIGGRLAANTVYTVATDLKPNVAYNLNVTAIAPSGLGNLRIAPANDWSLPTTSLVNYQAGKDVANSVIVKTDNFGELKLYSEGSSVAVAIDVVGMYPIAGDGVDSLATPLRLADTRKGSDGPIAGGTSRSFQISSADFATGATSVALNVTAVSPSALGNLRIYADGAAMPTASNINYIVGQDKSAFVIVDLPANGKIRVYSDGGTAGVAIDAFASFNASDNLVTAVPVRVLDTRKTGSLAADTAMSISVTAAAGIPSDAQAVLVSVTGIHRATSTGFGNLRVYPTAGALPVVSTLNYVSKSSDVANFAIVKLGANGEITLYSDGSPIDVAVDVLGYVPAGE